MPRVSKKELHRNRFLHIILDTVRIKVYINIVIQVTHFHASLKTLKCIIYTFYKWNAVIENTNDLKTVSDDIRTEFMKVPPITISTLHGED